MKIVNASMSITMPEVTCQEGMSQESENRDGTR